MRIKILFWNYNTGKGSLMAKEPSKGSPLARVARSLGVDLFIITDCDLSTDDILAATSDRRLDFSAIGLPHKRIRFFGRSGGPTLKPVADDDRMVFYRLGSSGFEEILIGATHLYGRQYHPLPQTRKDKLAIHLTTLAEAEKRVGHDRTLLVGDFNMTPDEMGMVSPENAFGAMMTWELAEIHSRAEPERPRRFFNPMWAIMGRSEAPGTYYWKSTDPYNIYWLCVDGVLARPSLRGVFREETLKIITTIPNADAEGGECPLVRFAERHWLIEYSDHLPIFFELDLREKAETDHG